MEVVETNIDTKLFESKLSNLSADHAKAGTSQLSGLSQRCVCTPVYRKLKYMREGGVEGTVLKCIPGVKSTKTHLHVHNFPAKILTG